MVLTSSLCESAAFNFCLYMTNYVCTLAHEVLRLCDQVRDDVLPNLGVRLEDHNGKLGTVVK